MKQQYTKELDKLGLKAELLRERKHFVMYIVKPDGGRFKMSAPRSSSDWRSFQNWRATLLRKLRE